MTKTAATTTKDTMPWSCASTPCAMRTIQRVSNCDASSPAPSTPRASSHSTLAR